MYKILRQFGSGAIALAVLISMAGQLPVRAADSNLMGFTDYETFLYADAAQMTASGYGNLRGTVTPADGNLIIPAPTSNGQNNGIKKNGAVQQRTYIVETRFKLDYPETPSGSAAIIIYDGTQRNDYRFLPTQLNHRNSTGTGGAWNPFTNASHVSGKWYTYRFESDGEGFGMTYRKTDEETDFTPIFSEKQPLNNNTSATAIDMFAEGAATNISMTVDYLKTYYPFDGMLGEGGSQGLQSAYLADDFTNYANRTVTVDSEHKTIGPWKLAFKDASTTQAVFSQENGTLTMNANGDTQTLTCNANLEEFHDVIFDIRCKLTGSMTTAQGLGIQINGDSDRVFVRLNNQRIHYNKDGKTFINATYQTPQDKWINLRIEKIGAKANIYCKSDSDETYTQVFANLDTIPKVASTNYFISLFIESAADMAVTIDSVGLHAAGSCGATQHFDSDNASTYQITDYSEINAVPGIPTRFQAFLAAYTPDGQTLQAIAGNPLAVGTGDSGSVTVRLPQQQNGSIIKSLLWDEYTLCPAFLPVTPASN